MINQKSIKRADELIKQYEYNWGRRIETNHFLPNMTQEEFVVVLERIVETGESVIVGWNKCFMEK